MSLNTNRAPEAVKTALSGEVTNAHWFSSESNEWYTPQEVFDRLDKEFGFTLDPCATADNTKCPNYYTMADDGLAQDWSKDTVFMNPPYGRGIGQWIKKAHDEALRGATVICLIPARTDTVAWHDYIFSKAEVRFM